MKNNSPLLDNRHSEQWYEDLVTISREDLTWRGVCVVKHPNDLFSYAEIVHATRPDIIIETGAFLGGSALFLADVCELQQHGQVLSVELDTVRELPVHPRLTFLRGLSSTDPQVVDEVRKRVNGRRGMVVLDSAHNKQHVLHELNVYSGFVGHGCYLIVEDTNVHGYKLGPGDIMPGGGGPAEAVKSFQPSNRGFEIDRHPERFRMTQNPGGFLRRVR